MPITSNYETLTRRSLQNNVQQLNEVVSQILSEVQHLNVDYSYTFGEDFCLNNEVKNYEIYLIKLALRLSNGKQRKAAQILGLKSTTLNNKIVRYQILDKR